MLDHRWLIGYPGDHPFPHLRDVRASGGKWRFGDSPAELHQGDPRPIGAVVKGGLYGDCVQPNLCGHRSVVWTSIHFSSYQFSCFSQSRCQSIDLYQCISHTSFMGWWLEWFDGGNGNGNWNRERVDFCWVDWGPAFHWQRPCWQTGNWRNCL